jgi:molecular chaperone GrpE (heat shock protein)
MNEVPEWKVPKWPFIAAFVLLAGFALVLILKAEAPLKQTGWLAAAACLLGGSFLGCLPYLLEYRAAGKLLEMNTLGTVAEQLSDLKKYSADLTAATDRWALVQETTKGNTDKTVAAAGEIAARMTEEIREFNEFQVKLNDTEKGALRLEVEKLRRTEADWLQVAARILDQVFALQHAAAHSGNPELAAQLSHFQNVCRDAARRVGLAMFDAVPDEAFDARKHQARDVENPPAGAVVAETLAPGITFQGRLLRPVLVSLHAPAAPVPSPETVAAPEPAAVSQPAAVEPVPLPQTPAEKTATPEPGKFSLGTD